MSAAIGYLTSDVRARELNAVDAQVTELLFDERRYVGVKAL